jgi:hypothetical protein
LARGICVAGSEENPGLDYRCEKESNEINAAEFNLQPRLDQYEKFTRSMALADDRFLRKILLVKPSTEHQELS